jgi:hypothetical protein
MTALSARFIEQSIQQGIFQGMQQDMQQEAVNMLVRQIKRRLGSVSDEIRQRLNSAETDQLEHWADNILDAKTLDDVFRG